MTNLCIKRARSFLFEGPDVRRCYSGPESAPMNLGRTLIWLGGLLAAMGVAILLLDKLNIRPGRLPGDIVWRGKNSTVYFPLATCLLLSVLFTLLMAVLRRK